MDSSPARSFRDLVVWQKAHALVLHVYRLTAKMPKDERFGITSQWRRAMVSVPANIAEGFRKRSKRDKARFMNIAEASLEESRYYAILTRDLGFLDDLRLDELFAEVSRLLDAYVRAVLADVQCDNDD